MNAPRCPCLETLRSLRDLGILRDIDVHLVEAVARTHGVPADAEPAAWLALALASRAVDDGHVCLDLDVATADWVRDLRADDAADGAAADNLPDATAAWCRKLSDPASRGALFRGWEAAVGAPADEIGRAHV